MALARLEREAEYKVVALLTSVTKSYDRVSIHGVRRALLAAQGEALGLPIFVTELNAVCSNDEYEAAFLDSVAALGEEMPWVRHIAFGDLFLEDVRAYRERLMRRSGLSPLFPLWRTDTGLLAEQCVKDGYRAHLVCVDTQQLDGAFAGREYDSVLLSELPAAVDPCGERGEFHTFVHSAPIFKHDVSVTIGETVLRDNRFAFCDLLPSAPSHAA